MGGSLPSPAAFIWLMEPCQSLEDQSASSSHTGPWVFVWLVRPLTSVCDVQRLPPHISSKTPSYMMLLQSMAPAQVTSALVSCTYQWFPSPLFSIDSTSTVWLVAIATLLEIVLMTHRKQQWRVLRGLCSWILVCGCLTQWGGKILFEKQLKATRQRPAEAHRRVWEI